MFFLLANEKKKNDVLCVMEKIGLDEKRKKKRMVVYLVKWRVGEKEERDKWRARSDAFQKAKK